MPWLSQTAIFGPQHPVLALAQPYLSVLVILAIAVLVHECRGLIGRLLPAFRSSANQQVTRVVDPFPSLHEWRDSDAGEPLTGSAREVAGAPVVRQVSSRAPAAAARDRRAGTSRARFRDDVAVAFLVSVSMVAVGVLLVASKRAQR